MSANHEMDDQPELRGDDDERWARRDEGRRVARELHESTAQLLAGLQLKLQQLSELADPSARPLIDECKQAIREIHEQIRALDID